jgi:hypothetical protein
LSADAARACWAANERMDVGNLLPLVQAPTLVHRRDFPMLDLNVARGLPPASRARLKISKALPLAVLAMQAALKAIFEFIGSEAPQAAPRPGAPAEMADRRLPAIMFTDMEGSTAVTQRLGDAAAQELVRVHNSIVADALAGFAGKQLKHTATASASLLRRPLPSSPRSPSSRVAVQRGEPAAAVYVRIGINAGEPVEEGDDLFGRCSSRAASVIWPTPAKS